ncbi:benzaldehyde dehydrogenase [Larsenimonas suaedae]|uniref:Benzaldehyde dehydrogenase n=1 Tax=Larsenimonas suaedae TaxID=1851019 RepID=A0ABU1GRY1_9GAMM|nr:benzaldehyde dehydrogenase [Larsenimonas suaedae]MCM2972416.1 benzaldehyde dehydrogenase [Larsenimonas suaedae]MDR5894788.1 benzaldehyde dehydrogenase [Larsenimonas suaedae]
MTDEQFLAPALWKERLFTGRWVEGAGETITVRAPASGETLGQAATADAEQVASAARASRDAAAEWFEHAYDDRAEVLRQAARLAEQHRQSLEQWLVSESGSTQAKAAFEVMLTIKALYKASELPSAAAGEVLPSTPGRLSLARRRPLGVVGVIAPFNFPLYLAMRAVAPALALGNGVVLKPDPRTTVCGGFSIARLFECAGLPAGVLSVLPGGREVGSALVEEPNITMIQFTGSTAAGRKIGERAGAQLKKVSLELGGKNALIVLDDADIEQAVSNASWGTYLHQGQICMSCGRILVHRAIYDTFVEQLTERAKGLNVGDPASEGVALGPLIDEQQRDHAVDLLARARDAGASVRIGGETRGLFFQPAVVCGVKPDNPLFYEETFAPVAVVIPFDSDDDAVALANDTEYGLSAGVISRDVGRALRLGERLHTGLLHINDQTVNDEVINPFGGVGASGNGTAIGGPASLDEFTQWQWLTLKSEAPIYPL